MPGLTLEPGLAEALTAVARDHNLTVTGGRLYGNGDTMVGFSHRAHPRRLAALLPIDHCLRSRLASARSVSALRGAIRDDGFSDTAERDDARDLCRLGLVGCHALSELLPPVRIALGLRVRVLYDTGAVEVATEANPATKVIIAADLIRLLGQFQAVDRFARAYHACAAQLSRLGV